MDAETTTHCRLADGCTFVGTWSDYLEHAPLHPLPHPDNREAWLAARRTFVGASEVPALLGVNPYATALDVWAAKVQGIQKRNAKLEARATARLGHLMEPVLLRDYAQRHGCEIVSPPSMRHPSEPWAGATPDGIASTGELVQVKLVGARMLHHWSDGPPIYARVQCQWELYVAERERLVLLAGLGGTDVEEYPIERDDELIDGAVELVRAFWRDSVITRTMPSEFYGAPSKETLAMLFPRNVGQLMPAPQEVIDLCYRYVEHRTVESGAKEEKEKIGADLKLAIGDGEGFTFRDGKVTWKNAKGSTKWEDVALDLAERLGLAPSELQQLAKAHTPAVGERRLTVNVKE